MLQKTSNQPYYGKVQSITKNIQRYNASCDGLIKQDTSIRWTVLELNSKDSEEKVCNRRKFHTSKHHRNELPWISKLNYWYFYPG